MVIRACPWSNVPQFSCAECMVVVLGSRPKLMLLRRSIAIAVAGAALLDSVHVDWVPLETTHAYRHDISVLAC